MSEAIPNTSNESFEPQIVSFFCTWCSYTGADLAGTSRMHYPSSIRPIRVMCSSRVDPLFIIDAFLKGADAILIAGCHPGDCHYQKGNYHARRRFALVSKVFENLGLESNRLKLSWISASEAKKLSQIARDYTKIIQEIGPNPTKYKIFL